METRILIVDDDPFICRQLEELYASQQYTVSSAPNAQEALRLLAEHDYSLAVVDLKISGTDGIGLTRARLWDSSGAVGQSLQSLLLERRAGAGG